MSASARVVSASDSVLDKAARLLDENRVVLSRRVTNCAVVCGDTGNYHVWAEPAGVTCECYGGTGEHVCAHMIAAMVAWYERDSTTPFGPPSRVEEPPFTGFAAALKEAI
jgi:hypothetical protein